MKFALETLDYNMEDLNSLSLDFAQLENETQSCDLLIYTGSEETLHRCHRLIFQARCKHFPDILEGSGQQPASRMDVLSSRVIKLPDLTTEVFSCFKHYLYSGRVVISMENIIALVNLAQTYGVASLESLVISYARQNLTIATVCLLVNKCTASIQNNNVTGADSGTNYLYSEPASTIFSFFKDNISILRQRKSISELSKDSLIYLLRMRLLDIEENEIWRIALEWAKLQVALPASLYPNQWSEEQRNYMRATLDGVVQHIQFISIDSSVFSEEVEPAGVVPFQLTRERFKHSSTTTSSVATGSSSNTAVSTNPPQSKELSSFERARNEFLSASASGGGSSAGVECARALPRKEFRTGARNEDHNKNRHSEDLSNRLNPRAEMTIRSSGVAPGSLSNSNNQRVTNFHGSSILASIAGKDERDYNHILSTWVASSGQSWTVLFRGSDHDFSAEAFHRICDGAAPSIVLVKADTDNVGGGYTDIPWSKPVGKGKYVPSEKSFLFSLYSPGRSPTKFDIKKRLFAVSHHPDCGPVFGAGADLFICDECDQTGDSYSNLPHSYDGQVHF